MPGKETSNPSTPKHPARKSKAKPTNIELDRRFELLATLLARGHSKYALLKTIYDQGWASNSETANRYIRGALQWLAKAAFQSRDELRARVHIALTSIIRSAQSDAIRLRALAQLCDLWGLNAPSEQLVGGIPGQPVEVARAELPAVLVLPSNESDPAPPRATEVPIGPGQAETPAAVAAPPSAPTTESWAAAPDGTAPAAGAGPLGVEPQTGGNGELEPPPGEIGAL